MAEAYHKEALRKQRIIDKKNAALARIAVRQQLEDDRRRSEEQRHRHEMAEREHEKARKREEYLSSMGRTGRSTQGVINANFVHMPEEKKNKICQKDLRHQERVLRDSCLVMGRVNEYFLA
ncbi:GRB10-interacting GYF protein 2 [Pocillopora verrucosa]|uniref:GRB10-interacting GYF protein 2 n=1 Tax=Pocillopora verrucosa TaxID=203993 RepID=UPI000F554477|nr:uncharacterized protein LOC113683747 isoform X1 [Pocillopora damicornis]XP_058946797.1 uncharacterized protein LOC131774739 [Pocillopora verrucosa]